MPDNLLDKAGLKFEDLNAAERETYNQWLESLSKNTLTLASVRDYVQAMKDQVEGELVAFVGPKTVWDFLFRRKKDVYLTARLRNYMLLLTFLSGPEKAKKALERSLSNIKPKH
jgi:hypothetical protein